MLGLGCGEILGSVAWGKITDKLPMPQVILINAVAMSVGYGFLFLYTVIYDFAYYLGILMTFFWGVQDSGMNCLLSSLLGFQFESKTTPFSVYKFLQSLLIFVFTCIESTLSNETDYLTYFVCCQLFSLAAWFILKFFFNFLSKEEVEALRNKSVKPESTMEGSSQSDHA